MANPSLQNLYSTIEDAKKTKVHRWANLFAAVAEIGAPKKSSGTDYVLTLKIVDPSYRAPGLPVNFFAKTTSDLPTVKSNGDIISLHRVKIRLFKGDHYCVCYKDSGSFAVFEGKSTLCLPYQTSMNYRDNGHVDNLLLQLRTWLHEQETEAGLDDTSVLLKSIVNGQIVDFICKIVHMRENAERNWILFVWDGTDAPTLSFETNLDIEGETPCPLCPEDLPLSREVLCGFPCVGTVLRIFASNSYKEFLHLQGNCHWVRICNMTCDGQSGIWKGALNLDSKIRILSNNDVTVLRRERLFKERTTSEVERLPIMMTPTSHVTETDYEHVAYATLMDSLTHPEVTHKFKSIVRVITAYPWRGEDLRSPVTGHYRMRLTLEDPTARIHAYLYKDDGAYFFGGNLTPAELSAKMKRLLGIADGDIISSRNPPWMQCCLKSYYINKSDPWESRKFKIFATRLVG